jgi:peptide chain release factor 1
MSDTNQQWSNIQTRVDELSSLLMADSLDYKKRESLQKEHSRLSKLLNARTAEYELQEQITQIKQQLSDNSDQELTELYQLELEELALQLKEATTHLEDLMYPPDELDASNVFLEIRAGAGGQEAALFAGDLLKLYTNYAMSKNWRTEVVNTNSTDIGGIKEVILGIKGRNIYGNLKYESGVHRVQRVPQTEGSGRVHTSTATVAVMPEITGDTTLVIDPNDLRIDVFRASGAGGQHVNTTDSAVRITHIPTGVVVSCQDERSQHKNKAKALKVLKARIAIAQREQKQAEQSAARKEQVGTGMRAEKVRTYNYPQNRVTDHVAHVTLNKLDIIMQGDLDEIIEAHQEEERKKRLAKPLQMS